MNVLFLTYMYQPAIGGVERTVSALAAELVARGHRALVVTHAPVRFYAYEPGPVPVLRLRIPPQCEAHEAARRRAAWRNAFNLAVLTAFALRFRADAVSAHSVNMDTLYARRVARVLRIPHVVTLHGSDVMAWGRLDEHRTRYVAAALEAADRVTAVANLLLEAGDTYVPGLAARGRVIPNMVDAAALEAVAGPRDPAAPRYVLCAGRLSPEKRFEIAIDAFHALARDGALGLELRIAGDGPCAADLRARAAAGPAAASIRFLGELTHDETARQMRSPVALVLCSAREGCPHVVLEAMALGTPVLCSDIPAAREMIEPGVTGTLFGDAGALASAIRDLARDPGRHRDLAAAARRRVDVAHAPDRTVDAYLSVFSRQA